MTKFLNTDDLVEIIPELIETAQSEVVIAVPYIQTSEKILRALRNAEKNNVEVLIIFRENKLNNGEEEKFQKLSNISLIAHPNLHAKCYMNEEMAIITSLNMYAYSERNNREMGVLINIKESIEFSDNLKSELQQVLNGCEDFTQKSELIRQKGFHFQLLKTSLDQKEDYKEKLKEVFNPKKIEILSDFHDDYRVVCRDFYDRVDADFTDQYRWFFRLGFGQSRAQRIFKLFQEDHELKEIEEHRVYWNYPTGKIYLYAAKAKKWVSNEEHVEYMKKGAFQFIQNLKKHIDKTKN